MAAGAARGKAVLYTSQGAINGVDNANIVVQPLPTGARMVVPPGGFYGRYLPSGHLVYMHEGTLFVAPFDLNRLEVAGQPVPALDGVAVNVTTGAQFAVAGNGTLVYLPGQSVGSDAPIRLRALRSGEPRRSEAAAGRRTLRLIAFSSQLSANQLEAPNAESWLTAGSSISTEG